MRAQFRPVIGIAVMLGMTVSARQSAQTPPAQPAPSFGARTEAVVVDVTVTDRKGRPVTTLTQSDFDVFEDNTAQKILTFERRGPEPGARADAAAAAAGVVGAGRPGSAAGALGPSVTALAFDHLSPEARNLAFQAAEHFVQHKQADELAGVFIVDQALATVAPYTTDAAVLDAAVKKVAVTATSALERERNGFFEQIHVPTDTPAVASAEEQGRSDGDHPWVDPAAKAEAAGDHQRAAEINAMIRMERSYQDMLTEVQGHASMDALLALVDSLGAVPGRKAVLYFCEGLTIPSSLEARFRSIIHTANRSNVTVYTVDAAGLRVHSDQATTAQAVQEYGAMGVGDVERRGKFMNELEDNEKALTKDPAVSLGILADQTGGILINNTNDLENGVDRINQDRRNYYLLSYSSTNPAFDGTFHRIKVTVKKSGLDVRARSGYVAAPMTSVSPVADYEIPAIEALTATPLPTSFPFQVVAASVPVPGRPGLAVISATIPGTSLLLHGDQATGRYTGGAVIVARVVDDKGVVQRKLSQQYRLRGALAEVQSLKNKTLTFTRFPDLDEGHYRVDVAVYDAAGERASVVSQALVIPPAQVPVVGDLLIVDHAERLPPDQPSTQGNPFVVDGLLLKPVINPTIHGRAIQEVNFALPLSLVPGKPLPSVALSLLSMAGKSLASVQLVLETPDAAGRLMAVGRVPLTAVPPGNYQLQVTVGAGPDAQTRKTPLTVVD